METTINRILELSRPLPDEAAHVRYLRQLKTGELRDRVDAMEADLIKHRRPRWSSKRGF